MNTRFWTLGLLAPVALLAGCVTGGMVALPEGDGDVTQLAGQLLLVDAPFAGVPLRLIAGTIGITAEANSSGAGAFRFDLTSGEYHLGVMLPADPDEGISATHFLIRFEATEEPIGLTISCLPEMDERAWHIDFALFDDEDGDGIRTGTEAILEDRAVDVPFGSREDLILNPSTEEPEPEDDDHGHSHG